MQIEAYVQALRDDLVAAAALGDESTARAAQLLAVALESSFGRRLLEALTEASAELASQLDDARVEVRLVGRDPELVVVDEQQPAAQSSDEVLSARITLRLQESLKNRIEEAAARDGLSVNTWVVQALIRNASAPRRGGGGRRLTGYGQS